MSTFLTILCLLELLGLRTIRDQQTFSVKDHVVTIYHMAFIEATWLLPYKHHHKGIGEQMVWLCSRRLFTMTGNRLGLAHPFSHLVLWLCSSFGSRTRQREGRMILSQTGKDNPQSLFPQQSPNSWACLAPYFF